MQSTSTLYKQIIARSDHYFETRLDINGHPVLESKIMSVQRERAGMTENKPTVGGALSSTLDLTIIKPTFAIPKMAEIKVYVRAVSSGSGGDSPLVDGYLEVDDTSIQNGYLVFGQNSGASIQNNYIAISNGGGESASEWIQQGTYYIDTREYNDTGIQTMRITAFDAMMKAEQDYPDTNHNWPYLDKNVVSEIAQAIGVSVDSRVNNYLTAAYMIQLPTNYTMREVLEHIAASYCGNFVITSEGKLMFVPLYGIDPPEDGNYLADDSNGTTALMFGSEGWYIIV